MPGYVPCACRDCFDVAVSGDDNAPTLCLLCEDAGCLPCLAREGDCAAPTAHDCQRPDAYGVEAN